MFDKQINPAALMDDTTPKEREITNPLEHYNCNALELLQATAVDIDKEPEPLKPLLLYCDGVAKRFSPFLFRGTLSIICGQKGCRKSTLTRALVQILVNGGLPGKTPYTITPAESGLKVAVIDTEQHNSRVYKNFYKWLYDNAPDKNNFAERCQYYTTRGNTTDDLVNILWTVCEHKRPDVIVLDVISHFIDDINDQKNSKILVDILNLLMREYGVAFVGVIHQNPNKNATADDKPAGAIGTKLLQAAEVTLTVSRMPDNTKDNTAIGETPGMLVKEDAEPSQENLFGVGFDKLPKRTQKDMIKAFEKSCDEEKRNGMPKLSGSVVEFATYRERTPARKRFGIVNDNGANDETTSELFILPIESYHETKRSNDDTEPRADVNFVPSLQVEQLYGQLTANGNHEYNA